MSAARAPKQAVAAANTTGPPLLILGLAALCIVTGAALVPTSGEDLAPHVAGYLAASVLAIVLIGLFRRFDLTRRLTPGYRPRAGIGRTVTVLLLAAFAVAGLHVWAIATELAS